jgi:hypothetical protein
MPRVIVKNPRVAFRTQGNVTAEMLEGHVDRIIPERSDNFINNGVSQGSRNEEAFQAALQLRDCRQYTYEEACDLIVQGAEKCDPLLSRSEAISAVRSAWKGIPRDQIGKGSKVVPFPSAKKSDEPKVKPIEKSEGRPLPQAI